MKKAFRVIKITVRTLVVTFAVLLLAYNVYTLIMRYAYGVGIPTVFGYGFAAVQTGSMEPQIAAGDFIVIHAEDEYAVGDVITFYDSARGEYVTHRIIQITESGFTTKGDANNAQDLFTVPQGAVVGKVVAVMNGLGSFIAFLQTPAGMFVLIAAAAAVWGATVLAEWLIERHAKRKAAEPAEGADAGGEGAGTDGAGAGGKTAGSDGEGAGGCEGAEGEEAVSKSGESAGDDESVSSPCKRANKGGT